MNGDTSPAALAVSYALARHVPDMARGFTIATNYGELSIAAAEAFRHPEIARAVESILQMRLRMAERGSAA
jgi:hypothetical protein